MLTAAFLAFVIVAAVAEASRQPHEKIQGKQSPFPGQAASATPGITDDEQRSGGSSGQGRVGLVADRNAGGLPPTSSYWHRRFLHMRHLAYERGKRVKQLKRTLMSVPTVSEAINLAGAVYGNTSMLWQLARCESTLNPNAQNPSGSSGLFQFMPSTFASTPFGRFSIWSPYANALAGGWMLAHGRRSEWVC